jgi:hypothetical protein
VIASVPPSTSRKPAVALGVSVAFLVYAASLTLQRAFPALQEVLAVSLAGEVKATYYGRVALGLAAGAAAALLAPRGPQSEARLAWGIAAAMGLCVVLICLFP